MQNLQIIKADNNPNLKKKCTTVINNSLYKEFTENLLNLMYKSNGVGIAANQVGVLKNIIIVLNDSGPLIMFNPKIIDSSPELVLGTEGCLSFENIECSIERPKWVKVQFSNLNEELHTVLLENLAARIFFHEYDHLNGITMLDRKK